MTQKGRFVGFGVGTYTDPMHEELPHATSEVMDFAQLVRGDLDGDPAINPTTVQVFESLDELPPMPDGGRLVLMWSGHGKQDARDGLRLLTTESGTKSSAGLAVAEVVRRCIEVGANQVLVVLDACFSGGGVPAASEVAAALIAQQPPKGLVWVGVLASCAPWETARDGAFGQRLLDLVKHGPDNVSLRRPWSVHNEFLRGEDIGDALLREWKTDGQHLSFRRDGVSDWLVQNPLFEPHAPAQVVEHLLRAARSGGPQEQRSWFTGRTREVDTVVSWVTSGMTGLHVVTGSAGTGKSAITGRVVSASVPSERALLVAQGPLGHADPGEESVAAHVYLRGLTLDQAAASLDRDLITAGVLPRDDAGDRNAALLVGALQRRANDEHRTPVLVVDGLDEARGQAFVMARELLARLAAFATVVVSTRNVLEPGEESPNTLVDTLQPVEVLNLDDERWAESGRLARREYLGARLSDVDPRMSADAVANYLTKASTATTEEPFLLARLVSDQLRAAPVDTTVLGWREHVAGSIFAAVDTQIAAVPTPLHRELDQATAASLARGMLTALTWGLGAGFPEPEWVTVAATLCADIGFNDIGQDDVSWLLDSLGRFVLQDGQFGNAVFRVAHQSLADHLRPPFRQTAELPFDPATMPVTAAILDRYRALLDAGIPATSPGYLWQYAWRHAASAGPQGLNLLRDLADVERALRPDVGIGALAIAATLGEWGRRADALPPTQEA
ncbi:hypothetical protein N865_01145, partial [Intrasporangium oryzae NRRL B-24470]